MHQYNRLLRPAAPRTALAVRARSRALLFTALIAAAALPSAARAQPPNVNPNEFVEIGGYVLLAGGDAIPGARFFRSKAAGTVLISAEPFSGIAELAPRQRQMRIFPQSAFTQPTEGVWLRKDEATPVSTGTFQIVDELPRFDFDGVSYSMKIKPPLLGKTTQDEIIEYDPTWGTRAKLYEPFAQYLNPLFDLQDEVRVKIFFGSWCNHCQDMVPKIFKVEQQLVNTPVKFEYYGVPRDIQSDELAKQFDVGGQLPFGVIYVNGEERQRAQGLSWRFPDMAIFRAVTTPPR